MSSIVKLKDKAPGPGTVDLRHDNRIGDLLDEYELAKRTARDANKALKVLTDELDGKIGDAKVALVDGWIVKRDSYPRREFTVKATIIEKLIVERKPRLTVDRERAARMRRDEEDGE